MTYDDTEMDEERSGRFTLERILSALRQRILLVAAAMMIVGGLTALVASMLPTRYEAVATVQVDPRRKSISNMEGVISDLSPTHVTIESEVEVIQSRALALKVIDILDLRSDPEFGGNAKVNPARGRSKDAATGHDPISRLLDAPSPGTSHPERDIVAANFAARLKVSRVRVTLLIDIRFSSTDPVKAAKIANTIAEFYLNDQVEEKQKAASYATDLLEEKLQSLKTKVEIAERRIAAFKAKNDIFDTSGEILSEKQLSQQMAQMMETRTATAAAKGKYEQVQRLLANGEGAGAIADVLNSDIVKVRKDALATATRREAELETRYGPKHPEMRKVRAEVRESEAQLQQELRRVADKLKNEYEVAVANERQASDALSNLESQQIASKDVSVELLALQREAATEKQLFEALLARYKQTSETQNLQLPDSRIVESAGVPLGPSGPKRRQIVLIGLLAGQMLGLFLALGLEFFTKGITHPDDLEHTLALSHLSSIPALSTAAAQSPLRSLRMILAEPRSAFTDAVRGARREIDARCPRGAARIVLVASALPKEGSDVIASNLAHHYAVLGSRVLLIDADVRRAALSRRLAPAAQAGLLEILHRYLPFEQTILRDATTGLNFLPAMRENSLDISSPEMLASARMTAVFKVLKQQFDTIIVSAPPLLPVVDGRLLADHADQIVFVMTWRKTPKQLVRQALKALGHTQQKIIGVIMTSAEGAGTMSPAERTTEPRPSGRRTAA